MTMTNITETGRAVLPRRTIGLIVPPKRNCPHAQAAPERRPAVND